MLITLFSNVIISKLSQQEIELVLCDAYACESVLHSTGCVGRSNQWTQATFMYFILQQSWFCYCI